MKSEKKEFVILSDVISMEEMNKSLPAVDDHLDQNTSDKKDIENKTMNKELSSTHKGKGETHKEKAVKAKKTVPVSKEKSNNNKNKKRNKKKDKKERLESLKAIKAINLDPQASALVSVESKRIETEKEKIEVQELLKAEMSATMADIQELIKSDSKENSDKDVKNRSEKEKKPDNAQAMERAAVTEVSNNSETKKKNRKKRSKSSDKGKDKNKDKRKENQVVAEKNKSETKHTVENKTESVQKKSKTENLSLTEAESSAKNQYKENDDSNRKNQAGLQNVWMSDTKDVSAITEKKEEGTQVKQHKSLKDYVMDTKFLIGSLVVLLLLIGYCSVAYNYRETFLMRTKINGIDCAGMTAKEAETALKEKVEDYTVNISFRDGSTEVIKGESINYKYISDGSVQKLMDKQISFLWLLHLIVPSNYIVPEGIEFDRGLLAKEYYALESTSPEKNIAPSNAYVTYEGDKFVIVPEDEGNQMNHHAFILELNKAIENSNTEISTTDFDIYARPTVFRDSKDLKKECDQLNKLAVVSVTYTLANEEYVMDGNEVRNWLKVDEQGNYSITEEEMKQAIKDFVDRLAKKVNTVGTERPFKATKQGDITVGGGTYGWKINKKEEIAKLTEEIANRAIVTREPCYSSRELTAKNNGFGDTYIEIDLTNQHLWYYIDGKLHLESDFVSGTYTNPTRRTPEGIFLLTYKQKDRILRGEKKEDGTYEYESPVSFWMPFNRGIGLHDATWRGSFGGTIYKYSGSHGCINLPYKKAQAIYEVIDKETPILCFY